jgi:peptide deformylase
VTHDVGTAWPAMALLPILEAPDPRRRVIATPVNMLDDGLRTLIAAMVAQMDDAPGIGLAVS